MRFFLTYICHACGTIKPCCRAATRLFLPTSFYFRNSSSFSKNFMISLLPLSYSFSCLLNFSFSFTKILICCISLSISLDFRALKRSLLDCVQVRPFLMLLLDLLEKSKPFELAGSVEVCEKSGSKNQICPGLFIGSSIQI